MAGVRIITRRGVGGCPSRREVTSGGVRGANPNAATAGPCRRGVIRGVRPTSHNSTARVDEHPQQAAIYGHGGLPRAASTASPDRGAARAFASNQVAGLAIDSRSGRVGCGTSLVVGCPETPNDAAGRSTG